MKIIALVTDAFGASGGIAQYNRDFLTALAIQTDIDAIKVLPRNLGIRQAKKGIFMVRRYGRCLCVHNGKPRL